MFGILLILIVVWAILSAMIHSEYCQDLFIYNSDKMGLPLQTDGGGSIYIMYGADPGYADNAKITAYHSPLAEQDALQYIDDVADLGYDHITLIGVGAGAYTAAYIANRRTVDALILDEPYMSAEDALNEYASWFIRFVPGRPGYKRKDVYKLVRNQSNVHQIGEKDLKIGTFHQTKSLSSEPLHVIYERIASA